MGKLKGIVTYITVVVINAIPVIIYFSFGPFGNLFFGFDWVLLSIHFFSLGFLGYIGCYYLRNFWRERKKMKRNCVLCGEPLHYVNVSPLPELIALIKEGEKKVYESDMPILFGAVCCNCAAELGLRQRYVPRHDPVIYMPRLEPMIGDGPTYRVITQEETTLDVNPLFWEAYNQYTQIRRRYENEHDEGDM